MNSPIRNVISAEGTYPLQYEYSEYVKTFAGGKVPLDGYTVPAARLFFWQYIQQEVWTIIKQKQDEGWEPIGEVGPAAISLRFTTESFGQWDVFQWFVYIAVGFSFFGIPWIILPFVWKYHFAVPVDFRVKMRRRKR